MTDMLKAKMAIDTISSKETKDSNNGKTKKVEAEISFMSKEPGFRAGLAHSSMTYEPKWAIKSNKGSAHIKKHLKNFQTYQP